MFCSRPLGSLALALALVAVALASLLTAPAVQANDRVAPPETGEMKSLFNGKDLSGWEGDPRLWSVRDGVIHGETTEQIKANGNTFLICQQAETKDFELRLSFRCTATNNSGIQYRSQPLPNAKNQWVVRGYQHELRNEVELPNVAGFIYGEQLAGRGRICLVGEKAHMEDGQKVVSETLITEEEFPKLFKLDDWNEVVIVAQGRHLRHYLNGRLVLDFTDAPDLALLDGVLALQLHAGKPMWAEFKDIRIKELAGR